MIKVSQQQQEVVRKLRHVKNDFFGPFPLITLEPPLPFKA